MKLFSFQPKLERRAEIEKKVEAAEKLEKAEAAVERREMFRERLLREEEIAELNAKMDRAQMVGFVLYLKVSSISMN